MELREALMYILSEYTGVKVTENTLLVDLPIDSLDHAELACQFEFKYGIKAENQQWMDLWSEPTHTVADLIKFVKDKL